MIPTKAWRGLLTFAVRPCVFLFSEILLCDLGAISILSSALVSPLFNGTRARGFLYQERHTATSETRNGAHMAPLPGLVS